MEKKKVIMSSMFLKNPYSGGRSSDSTGKRLPPNLQPQFNLQNPRGGARETILRHTPEKASECYLFKRITSYTPKQKERVPN